MLLPSRPFPTRASYVPEVDGLRALAVAAVLLFHAYPAVFPGGFIGVDMFFVISGFVIARTYLLKLTSGESTLKTFYIKRIRRLVPIYYLVLFISFVLGYILLTPALFRNFSISFIAQVFYAQNITFWAQGDYFFSAFTKPLLHTWSLAVEEQFYLLFGLFILLGRRSRRAMLVVIVGAMLGSVLLGEVMNGTSPKTSFYLLPTRVWEFVLGILAYWIAKSDDVKSAGVGTLALALGGFALAVWSIFGFTEQAPFPGTQAYVACLSIAGLMVLFERRPSTGYAPLAWRPVRYVGELSYSLYLWHWPVLVFWALAVGRPLTTLEATLGLALSFLLSALSYRYFEDPIRRKRMVQSDRRLLVGWAAGSAVIVALGVVVFNTGGALFRYPREVRTLFAATQEPKPVRCPYVWRVMHPGHTFCRLPASTAPERPGGVLLVGDSHADRVRELIAGLANEANAPAFNSVSKCDLQEVGHPGCSLAAFEAMLDQAKAQGIRKLVVTSFWPHELTVAQLETPVRAMVERGFEVAISENVPANDALHPGLQAEATLGLRPRMQPFRQTDYQAYLAPQRAAFDSLRAAYGVHILRPGDVLCPQATCAFDTHGEPNYIDASHLRVHAAALMRPLYKAFLFPQAARPPR